MKFIRTTLFLIIATFCIIKSHAVLQGDDINETIVMFNSEMNSFIDYTDQIKSQFEDTRAEYLKNLNDYSNELKSVKLSLYSQQDQYTFGNAFVSERALEICDKFGNKNHMQKWLITYNRSISRCERLKRTLEEIDVASLTPQAANSHAVGVTRINKVLNSLTNLRDSVVKDQQLYDKIGLEVESLRNDVEKNYTYITDVILFKKDISVTDIIKDFDTHWAAFTSSIASIFSTQYYGWDYKDEWERDFQIILLSGIIAFILGFLIARLWLIKLIQHKWSQVQKSPIVFSILCSWVFTIIAFASLRIFGMTNHFFIAMLNLCMGFCIYCIFLILSALLRVRNEQLSSTLIPHSPMFLLTLFILIFRALMVNILVIRIMLPASLLLVIIAQIAIIRFNKHKIQDFDFIISISTIIAYTSCLIVSYIGFYYVALQIAVAYSIFITGILLLSCYFQYLDRCERYNRRKNAEEYNQSWRPITFKRLFKPLALIITLYVCVVQCGRIFNTTQLIYDIFIYEFINIPNVLSISAQRICYIIIGAVIVNYAIGISNYFLKRRYKEKADLGAIGLWKKVLAITAWGVYIIISLTIIKVNTIGIIATLGGLAVGLGIALRDTFDCFLCGIMLMMGRVKIGDVVECGNEIRGKVIDIQYRTTLIETDDGAVISVFNTQFFGKDFRNVSSTGDYQRLHLTFKVQKEIDSVEVRKLLTQALIDNVPELAKTPEPKVLFSASDRFHVDMIAQVWVPIFDYYETIAKVKETLFNTLKANGMSNMSVDSRVRIIKNISDDSK